MQSRAHVIANQVPDVIDSEPDAHKARVEFDAIKWLAAKFNRADFGDDPPAPGFNVTINNDSGSRALAVLQDAWPASGKVCFPDRGTGLRQGGRGRRTRGLPRYPRGREAFRG